MKFILTNYDVGYLYIKCKPHPRYLSDTLTTRLQLNGCWQYPSNGASLTISAVPNRGDFRWHPLVVNLGIYGHSDI